MPRRYFSVRWLLVYAYLAAVFALDPRLPDIIQWASDRWTYESVSLFVLGVEIAIAFLLAVFAGVLAFYNRRAMLPYVLIVGGGIAVSYVFYRYFIPNPYELTHVPEYAVLGALVLPAIKGLDKSAPPPSSNPVPKALHKGIVRNAYLNSLVFAFTVGLIDELYHGVLPSRYFTYYDLFLNGLGAAMGLALMWALDRRETKSY